MYQNTYPIVHFMAQDILIFPVSTMASKSPFRISGRVLSKRMINFAPSTVEVLICFKDWELASKRMHEAEKIKALKEEMEKLNLCRMEINYCNSPKD